GAVAGRMGAVVTAPDTYDTGAPIIGLSAGGAPPYEIQLAAGGGSLESEFAIGSPGASGDGILRVFIGPPVNEGRTYWKGPYQHAVNLPVSDEDVVVQWTTNITSLLNANGYPLDGQRRPIRADILYNDNRLSQPWSAILPVTTASA